MAEQHTMPPDGLPSFSRASEREMVELRGECPRHVVDMLDAISRVENITRTAVVNRVLGEWAAQELHRATVIARVVGLNPRHTETAGA